MGLFSGPKAKTIEIKGIILQCNHCEHDCFYEDSRLLNSAGASFLGLDWANKQATLYVCENCKMIHWFAQ